MSSGPTNQVLYFAHTNDRARSVRFGIKQADRLSHTYTIGKTGAGKSTLLEILARQDLDAGYGFALIDPHGDLVERLVRLVPPSMAGRVRYLNATDPSQSFGYNPLRRVRDDKIPLAASARQRQGRDIGPQIAILAQNHRLRQTAFERLEELGISMPA